MQLLIKKFLDFQNVIKINRSRKAEEMKKKSYQKGEFKIIVWSVEKREDNLLKA